jgi:hypothetical protein
LRSATATDRRPAPSKLISLGRTSETTDRLP